MRNGEMLRETKETKVNVTLNLDGTGESTIDSGIGFMNHMFTLLASHGRFDLNVTCRGDLDVDGHHSVEDIGITLGSVFKQALGDKKGIKRYGSAVIPMDETLIMTALDLSGRAYLNFDVNIPAAKVGDFDTELIKEFFYGFIRSSECTLHIKQLYGENSHHIIEGIFKSFARALREAVSIDEKFSNEIPSTKGAL